MKLPLIHGEEKGLIKTNKKHKGTGWVKADLET